MKKLGIVLLIIIAILSIAFLIKNFEKSEKLKSPIAKEKPLDKYTFANLKKAKFTGSDIVLGKSSSDTQNYISQMFYFKTNGKKVSGLLNVPKEEGLYPVVVMLRGFVPKENYTTGIGTQRAGEIFP